MSNEPVNPIADDPVSIAMRREPTHQESEVYQEQHPPKPPVTTLPPETANPSSKAELDAQLERYKRGEA